MQDASHDDGIWFKGIKDQMERLIVQRKILAGESLDQSAAELFLYHVKEMCAAFARADTAEAAARKLAIKTIWRAAGRAGEPGALAYGGLKWNMLFECAVIESPQSKPSKLKFVTFPAGVCRHSDFLLDFGDNLVFQAREMQHANMVYAADETAWLLPSLQGGNPGTKLADYIKGLQPVEKGGLGRYGHVAVTNLPENPTAAGIRPGAADTLAMSVPAELAVHNTGHDLTCLSALWNYLNGRIALCMPGAIVLAGWQALPYGQLGKGPVHPKLTAITGVSMEIFEKMIDALFSLSDQSLAALRVGGALRMMLHATLATMLMYYDERFEAGEMHKVATAMRSAYATIAPVGVSNAAKHSKLIEWGAAIRRQFTVDNLHLRDRLSADGHEQTIAAIKNLGSSVGDVRTQATDTAQRVLVLQQQMSRVIAQQDTIIGLLRAGAGAAAAAAPSGAGASAGATAAAAAAAAGEVDVMDVQLSAADLAGSIDAVGASAAVTAASADALAASIAAVSSSVSATPGSHPLNQEPEPIVSNIDEQNYIVRDKLSGQFYLDCMALGNRLPISVSEDAHRKYDCQAVLTIYNNMATEAEKAVLIAHNRDLQTSVGIVRNLTKLLIRYVQQLFRTKGVDYKNFGKQSVLINTLVDKARAVKAPTDRSTLQSWRRRNEAGQHEEAGSGAEPGPSGAAQSSAAQSSAAQPQSDSPMRDAHSARVASKPRQASYLERDSDWDSDGEIPGSGKRGDPIGLDDTDSD